MKNDSAELLQGLVGAVVVADFRSSYVCFGTLVRFDEEFLDMKDADLHDFRDSQATREVYVYDAMRLGIRRNRARVLIKRDEVVAIAKLSDIAED